MSVASEITRIQNAKSVLKTSIENKGVTVSDSTLLSGYSALVDQIQTGGGGGGGQAEEDLIDLIEGDIVTLNIPNGTTKISNYAFYYYSSLTSITIPYSVTSIGNNAFNGCKGLTSIEIPDSVTSIGQYAFYYCTKLTSVTIGSGVTSIGQYAFQRCEGLTSVTIGNGITNISQQAFYQCSKLTSVTVEATTPPTLGANAFNNTSTNLIIYVPAESVDAYKAATNWKTYASRIKPITE